MDPLFVVVLVVALALFFDFTNGFHDTANAMATPIATGAMKPRTAVLVAAILNLAGAFLSTAVAKTISVDLINENVTIKVEMIFAGLCGAILWNLTTWILGLPSSSSHALFGGLIGAAVASAGFDAVNFIKVVEKVILPSLFAPVIAGLAAYLATKLAYIITARSQAERARTGIGTGRARFRIGQMFSSSLVALSHGTNDGQKTMGVITLVLISAGMLSKDAGVPLWVMIAAAITIGLGTYMGGWRIIKTLGTGLSEIKPAQGLASETATGVSILASTSFGFALSTTQVASGGVIGAGLGRKGGQVRWGKAGHVVGAWFLTLPAAAVVGALAAWIAGLGTFGILVDAVLITGAVIALFQISKRNAVTHTNVLSEVEGASEIVVTPAQRRRAEKAAKLAAKKAAEKAAKEAKKNKKGKN
ncbi:MAG: inorganic phosphate transporter family protein [Actinomycetales bacterium]|nr:inorganic phosphate transporter family protein [Actinomycetales bacterium]